MKLKDNFTYSFSILTFEKYSFLVLVKKKPPTCDAENLKKKKKKRMHVMATEEGY